MEREGTLEDISQLHSPRQHDQSSLEGALNGTSLHLPQTPTVTSGGGGGRDTGDILDGQPSVLGAVPLHACAKSLSHVQLFATPWTVVYQAPLSMGFSRQEYWSG